MKQVIAVNPFRCRVWQEHDRMEDSITEQSCKSEIESFLESGQLVPALGRPVHRDPMYEVELIYGARRLFVARHLNLQLLVELCDLSDREAIVALDIENRQRVDMSPYERGRSFARWLRSGRFSSQGELARALKISASQVSRLLSLAELPSVIVGAFQSPAEICERWGTDLLRAWRDPVKRVSLAARARAIGKSSHPLPSASVYEQLLHPAPSVGSKVKSKSHDEVVLDEEGKPLFRVRYLTRDIVLTFRKSDAPAGDFEEIKAGLTEVLRRRRSQPPSRLRCQYVDARAVQTVLERNG